MKTYSLDLRERAIAAVDRRMPRKEAVGVFGLSLATLKRWLKRREQTGSAAPKRKPGMRRRVGATLEERHALWRQLEENPEATLEEHRALWEREASARKAYGPLWGEVAGLPNGAVGGSRRASYQVKEVRGCV